MKSFQYLAPIAPFNYLRPNDMGELLESLTQYGSKAKLIAGGTDLTIALKLRSIHPETIIDLSRLRPTLSGITLTKNSLRIGAMTTYTELELNPNVKRFARALSEAASQVGTYQIRNLGTIGANLANGSPAADTAPPLITLSAKVNLQAKNGERTVPVEDFFTGVKKTVIRPDEVITSIEIPQAQGVSSYWMRAAKRNENVISVVSVAVASQVKGNDFGTSRIALGAVAPTPILAKKSSEKLTGSPITEEAIDAVAKTAGDESRPITDVRASAEYRRQLVRVLTKRSIKKVVNIARGIER